MPVRNKRSSLETEGGYEVQSNWTFGGTPGWQTISFSNTVGRYIRLETAGRTQIKDQFYEIQYHISGQDPNTWQTPPAYTGYGYGARQEGSSGGTGKGPLACTFAHRFKHKAAFIGAEIRGNTDGSQIGAMEDVEVYVYGVFNGGGSDSFQVKDNAVGWYDSSMSNGGNLVQTTEGGVIYITGRTYIFMKTRTAPGNDIWIVGDNRQSRINCGIAGSGMCPSNCGEGGGTTHVIDHNTVWNHTGARSSRVIINGGNTLVDLSTCAAIDIIDGNFITNTLATSCGQIWVDHTPNCNTITGNTQTHTGAPCYYGSCP